MSGSVDGDAYVRVSWSGRLFGSAAGLALLVLVAVAAGLGLKGGDDAVVRKIVAVGLLVVAGVLWRMVVVRTGKHGWPPSVPPLVESADAVIRGYVHSLGLGIAVNPQSPWRDRFGVWHGDFLEYDPVESLRSVRRAAVGGHTIRVEVVDGGYRATTTDGSHRVVRQSPTFETLASATAAALEHVQAARAEL